MLLETLKALYTKDLNRLKDEINLYQKEENLWIVDQQIANSAGNLCLHLVGNLKAFIGAELGKTGYIRDRPFEFAGKNVPRVDLIKGVEEAIIVVQETLDKLTLEDLKKEYAIQIGGKASSTELILIHLVNHLNYHLGQINYHRRLLDVV